MKRLLFASLVLAMFSGSVAMAQNNGGYVDDVYYNGTQAQKDAKDDAKKQKKQQQTQQDDAEYYNSSSGYDNTDGNAYDGNAQVYNNNYDNNEDTYIDYDDDSYTTRMRRFYYPMSGVGYWGSVYSPFWYDPFYSNPYYGWGGWYTPGFSIGFGFGGGPYWNNCWGMNTWYGYGGFGSWYSPFYGGFGWGGGYGAGYWNGYYAGIYDRNSWNSPYRRNINYGPRGARNGVTSVGAYGNGMRTAPVRGGGMVQPINGSRNSINNVQRRNGGDDRVSTSPIQADRQPSNNRGINRSDVIRLDNNGRNAEVNQNATGIQQERPARRGGFFNRGSDNNSNINRGAIQRSEPAPSRINMERSQPQRSYTPSAPSRSFSAPAPAPSRSSGGSFGGGGGGRAVGGRR
jgi:hypothetical protein